MAHEELLATLLREVFHQFGPVGVVILLVLTLIAAGTTIVAIQLLRAPRAARVSAKAIIDSLESLPKLLQANHEDHTEVSRNIENLTDVNKSIYEELRRMSDHIQQGSQGTMQQLLELRVRIEAMGREKR